MKIKLYTYFGYKILISVAGNSIIKPSCFDEHEKRK